MRFSSSRTRASLPIRLRYALALLALSAGAGCFVAGCTARRAAVGFDATRSHELMLLKSADCAAGDTMVVLIDGTPYLFAEHKDILYVKVSEGLHTIEYSVNSYRMLHAKSLAISHDAFLAFSCARKYGPSDTSGR